MNNPEYKKITVDFNTTSDGGSRKRRKSAPDPDAPPLKVRAPARSRDVNHTVKRNSLLKFIRRHQENNYKKHSMSGDADDIGMNHPHPTKSDLDDTLDYLMELTDQVSSRENLLNGPGPGTGAPSAPFNHTLKRNTPPRLPPSFPHPTNEEVSLHFPVPTAPIQLNAQYSPTPLHPKYGCLKGGQLPTYRTMMQTQARPPPQAAPAHTPTPTPYSPPFLSPPSHKETIGAPPADAVALQYVRQKRTNRRTYKIGKSKVFPKIGVLISNRTLRKNITTQSHQLKQTPIHEIRAFLIKHGLIKVGTTAPNEILRKMYESSKMLCGEVYNHNTDVLLHNFIHDTSSK